MSLAPRLALHGIALSSLLGLLVATGPMASAVGIDWVTVGNPGNAADTTGYGAVTGTYRIGKYEVTNAQYVEFLNAVAATDPNGLYNGNMNSSSYGGITQSGTSGSFTYAVKMDMGSKPVNYVSFYDALRFANWLHNGQPTGAQGSGTTEDGAYTMIAEDYLSDPQVVITRNTGAQVFLPSENEWYKAAFFNGTSYFDYPTGTDTQTTCALPGTTANTANCNKVINSPTGDVTSVGGYTNSASPYGTFDQGGNLWEMNEAIVVAGDPLSGRRGMRGGGWNSNPFVLGVTVRANRPPVGEDEYVGFRVGAVIPEPSTALLLAGGLAGLAAAGRRRSIHWMSEDS